MNSLLKAQYEKVNQLREQKAAIEGDDPYREMTPEELEQLFAADKALTEAANEMRRLEAEEETSRIHPSEQADF